MYVFCERMSLFTARVQSKLLCMRVSLKQCIVCYQLMLLAGVHLGEGHRGIPPLLRTYIPAPPPPFELYEALFIGRLA